MRSMAWMLLLAAALIAAAGGFGAAQQGKGKGLEKDKETVAVQGKDASTAAARVLITKSVAS